MSLLAQMKVRVAELESELNTLKTTIATVEKFENTTSAAPLQTTRAAVADVSAMPHSEARPILSRSSAGRNALQPAILTAAAQFKSKPFEVSQIESALPFKWENKNGIAVALGQLVKKGKMLHMGHGVYKVKK